MKLATVFKRKHSFFAAYFLLLTVVMLLGALLGCWLAEPVTRQLYAANVQAIRQTVQNSFGAALPWLLSAVVFPAAIFLVSQLRHGRLLVGAVVWLKGLAFGYAFAALSALSQQQLLISFLFRELLLLTILFWFCGVSAPKPVSEYF